MSHYENNFRFVFTFFRNNALKAVTPDNADDFNALSVEIELDGTEVTRVEEYTTPGQRIYEAVFGVDDLGPSQNEMDKVKALNGHYETEFFREMSSFRGNFNMAKFKLDMHDESKVKDITTTTMHQRTTTITKQQYIKGKGMPKELDLAVLIKSNFQNSSIIFNFSEQSILYYCF